MITPERKAELDALIQQHKAKQTQPGSNSGITPERKAELDKIIAEAKQKQALNAEGGVKGFVKGFGKGVLSTAKEAAGLGEKFLGSVTKAVTPDVIEPYLGLDSAPTLLGDTKTSAEELQKKAESYLGVEEGSLTTPKTTAQKVGFGTEKVAEFLLPSKGIGAATKATKAIAEAKNLGRIGTFAAKIAPQVASDIGVSTLQTGSPIEGIKTGATSAGLSGIGAGIGAVAKKVVPKISNAVGSAAKGFSGNLTGAKSEAIGLAFSNPSVKKYAQEAAKDSAAFNRGILDDLVNKVSSVVNKRNRAYEAKLSEIKKVGTELDDSLFALRNKTKQNLIENFDVKFLESKNKLNKLDFSKSVVVEGRNVVEEAANSVFSWRDTTPAGLDKLKKRLFQYSDQLNAPGKRQAKLIVDDMAHTIDQELKTKVKGYEIMTKEYREASIFLDEIKSAFSDVKNPKKANTVLKKVLSSLREGNELRSELLNILDPEIKAKIAGSILSSAAPRGISGVITPQTAILGGLGTITGLANPQVLLFLALTSPRLYAEFGNLVQKIPKNGKIPFALQQQMRAILLEAISGEFGQGQYREGQTPQPELPLQRTNLGRTSQ